MKNIRIERLNDAFQEGISKIIATEVKDDDIKFVTITEVDASTDLSYAKVYFTCLEDNKREKITEALNGAASFIRKCLAPRFDTLKIPELTFIYDNSLEYGKHIDELIDKIHEEKDA